MLDAPLLYNDVFPPSMPVHVVNVIHGYDCVSSLGNSDRYVCNCHLVATNNVIDIAANEEVTGAITLL